MIKFSEYITEDDSTKEITVEYKDDTSNLIKILSKEYKNLKFKRGAGDLTITGKPEDIKDFLTGKFYGVSDKEADTIIK